MIKQMVVIDRENFDKIVQILNSSQFSGISTINALAQINQLIVQAQYVSQDVPDENTTGEASDEGI